MKQIFIVLACCYLTTSLKAQYPLEDHMSWTESLSTWGYRSNFGGREEGFEFFLLGDTIINGKAYKKLYANELSSWRSWRDEVWEKYITHYTDTVIYHGNFGMLRMDSTDRLYFLRTGSLPADYWLEGIGSIYGLGKTALIFKHN